MHDLDLAILDLVQAVHTGWLDIASSIVGLFGQTEVTLGIALGVAVARWRRDPRDAVVPLFIVLTIVAVVIFGLGFAYFHRSKDDFEEVL